MVSPYNVFVMISSPASEAKPRSRLRDRRSRRVIVAVVERDGAQRDSQHAEPLAAV
jgi:hypothetical protein